MKININITINQSVKKRDIDEKFQNDFLTNFSDPDPYFMNDDLPENTYAISVLKSDCAIVEHDFDGNFFTRSIAVKILMEVGDWPGLKEFLVEDECFDDDGKFDATSFARTYLGGWEYVLIEVEDDEPEDILIERSDVYGDITVE